jgi:beta-glucanase (GH16 family)
VFTGMIATENIFTTQYGYFECRAFLTRTPGIFPAFWLQSPLIANEKGGTDVNGAEIDIFEYFPHTKKDSVAHTLHYGGYGARHRVVGPVWGALLSTKDHFHTFGLEWTPENYRTFVDGELTFSGNQLISKIPEFIVLSIDVNAGAAGPLQVSGLPDRFIVDYVRVYKKQ